MNEHEHTTSGPGVFITGAVALIITAVLGVAIGLLVIHPSNGPHAKITAQASSGSTSSSSSSSSSSASTSTSASSSTGSSAAITAGKSVFVQNCGGCHTLADAGSAGNEGPNLDNLKPSEATVAHQVENGGGAMPAFGKTHLLTSAQVTDVATYVSSVAGKK